MSQTIQSGAVSTSIPRFGQPGSDIHPTIGAAIDAYLEQHAVDWER
jgi:hypothetical protein